MDRIPPAFERRCIRAGRFAWLVYSVNDNLHYVMYSIHYAFPRLRSALLLGRIALLFTSRRALPARRLAALGARAALSTDCGQPVDRIPPAFERRCIRAGRFAWLVYSVNDNLHYVMYSIHYAFPRLRSALLLGRIALLFTSRRALPARRLAALGARAALSTDCGQPVDRIPPAFERRCIRAGRFAWLVYSVNDNLHYVMYSIHYAFPRLRSALLLGRIALLFTSRRALPARRLAALGARAALSTDC